MNLRFLHDSNSNLLNTFSNLSKNTTLQDIANALGIAKSTVSMALRNHREISDSLCQKVQKTAQDMGYRNNPLLSAHMANVRKAKAVNYRANLAFLYGWSKQNALTQEPILAQIYNAARKSANERGFSLEPFWLNDPEMTPESCLRILVSRGVHGIFVAPYEKAQALALDLSNFAAVTLGYSLHSPKIHRVCHDNYSAIWDAMERLSNKGKQRIGLALEIDANTKAFHQWLAGVNVFLQMNASEVEPLKPLLSNKLNETDFIEWLRQETPDVVLATDARVGKWLKQVETEFSHEIGLVSLATTDFDYAVSGIDHQFAQLADTAVELLANQVYHNQRGIPPQQKTVILPGRWLDKGTV